MKKDKILKKGGIDTILAYVVVSIPLFYVLIFMISTLYHFSVQMHINQTLKETLIMASSYGCLTDGMWEYLFEKIENVSDDTTWSVRVGIRKLKPNGEVAELNDVNGFGHIYQGFTGIKSGNLGDLTQTPEFKDPNIVNKGCLLSIELISDNPSLLGTVSQFSLFGAGNNNDNLKYSAFREEIITNVNPNP